MGKVQGRIVHQRAAPLAVRERLLRSRTLARRLENYQRNPSSIVGGLQNRSLRVVTVFDGVLFHDR